MAEIDFNSSYNLFNRREEKIRVLTDCPKIPVLKEKLILKNAI